MAVPQRDPGPQNVTLDNFEERWIANVQKALTEENPFPYQEATTYGNPMNLGPRIPDPNTWVTDMVNGAQNNAGRWLRNTLAPKKDPKAAASAASGRYNAAMQEVISQNRFKAGVDQYDQDAAIETLRAVGEAAYVNGINARKRKITNKITALHQVMQGHVATMDAMPTDTRQQRKAKMDANFDGMINVGAVLKGIRTGGR